MNKAVKINEGDKKRIITDCIKFVKNHNLIAEGGAIAKKKIFEKVENQIRKLDFVKGETVTIEVIKKSNTFDGKPCYFPFKVTRVTKNTVSVKYLN